jgi:hypothetical protein
LGIGLSEAKGRYSQGNEVICRVLLTKRTGGRAHHSLEGFAEGRLRLVAYAERNIMNFCIRRLQELDCLVEAG